MLLYQTIEKTKIIQVIRRVIMDILGIISGIFKPVADTIDELHTSDEERLKLRNELEAVQAKTVQQFLTLQQATLEASAKVAVAETQSDSWFTRSYRPIIVCGMFLLLCANSFGLLPVPLPDLFTTIFGSVFGITAVGRSVEKVKKLGK